MTHFRLLSIAALLPLLALTEAPGPSLTERALGERMVECSMAWAYRAAVAGPDEAAIEPCSKLQQDALSRIGGRCEEPALEQLRLYATEAWKHLPESELQRLLDQKEEEIYAVANATDPDAAVARYIEERECERWLNQSQAP